MKQIGDLLGRFKKYTRDSTESKKYLQYILEKNGISVPLESITMKKFSALITGSPILKTQLFLKQKHLVSECKKHPLTQYITSIR